jgi:VWFA-related protein
MRLLKLFLFLFGTVLILTPLSRQQKEVIDPEQHEVTVTLKLIQVYVSDKEGNPILDLTKDDFVLYDNGRVMTLTDFEIHRLTREEKPETSPEILPRINRKFFLLLDAYRNDAPGLKKARSTALHFINTKVHPTDEIGLLSYSIGQGLVIREPLDTSHDKIREAISSVKLFPSITSSDGGATAMQEAVDFTTDLNEFSVSLRYIPGYKYIILFSAGLPRSLFESGDPRLRYEFEKLIKELASSSTQIFTVDTQGTRDLIEGREQKGDDSLKRLSDVTGGHHFPNVDYQEVISRDIQQTTDNYYVLGYSIGELRDGKYHEIEVQVKRKGVKVRAQKGYFNPKVFSKLTKLEKRHHLLDLAKNSFSQYGLPKPMPSLSSPWGNSRAVLHLSEIVPAGLEEILAEKVEYFLLIYNEEGDLTAEGKKEMDYTKDPPEEICVYSSFKLPPGQYDCISLLRNKKTGAAAKGEQSVFIPGPQDSETLLSGPVLFAPGSSTLCLPVEVKLDKGKSISGRFSLSSITPITAKPLSPLIYMQRKSTSKLYAVFGVGKKEKAVQNLEFSCSLISKTSNRSISLKHSRIKDNLTDQRNIFVLELERPPVPPGEYVLEISATGAVLEDKLVFTQKLFVH